jgi:hypothetical protein
MLSQQPVPMNLDDNLTMVLTTANNLLKWKKLNTRQTEAIYQLLTEKEEKQEFVFKNLSATQNDLAAEFFLNAGQYFSNQTKMMLTQLKKDLDNAGQWYQGNPYYRAYAAKGRLSGLKHILFWCDRGFEFYIKQVTNEKRRAELQSTFEMAVLDVRLMGVHLKHHLDQFEMARKNVEEPTVEVMDTSIESKIPPKKEIKVKYSGEHAQLKTVLARMMIDFAVQCAHLSNAKAAQIIFSDYIKEISAQFQLLPEKEHKEFSSDLRHKFRMSFNMAQPKSSHAVVLEKISNVIETTYSQLQAIKNSLAAKNPEQAKLINPDKFQKCVRFIFATNLFETGVRIRKQSVPTQASSTPRRSTRTGFVK